MHPSNSSSICLPLFARSRRRVEPGDEPAPITTAFAGRVTDAAQLWLDAQLLLLHSNANAQRLLHANSSVLCLSQGRLHTAGHGGLLAKSLHSLKHRLSQGQDLTLGAALARPTKMPLILRLSLWRRSSGDANAESAWGLLVQLTDPHAARLDLRLLRDLFELTDSEARVAAALADGQASEEIAELMGVQANTVQAHVKKILAKTGTSSRAQLVALLWRSATEPEPGTVTPLDSKPSGSSFNTPLPIRVMTA